jgi:DMSO/TMAO reductase YedYZ molybdopterin-dependent catalytic subunit
MSAVDDPPRIDTPPTLPRGHRIGFWPAVLIGAVAVGLTLGIAELLAAVTAWAGFLDPAASPFGSLGAAFISITPEWLKDLGISLFGQSDKVALAVAMVITFLAVAVVIGLLVRVRAASAAAAGVLLVAVTAAAILTRPGAMAGDLLPIVIGGAVGIWFLLRVMRTDDDPYQQVHAAAGSDGAAAAAEGTMPSRRTILRASGVGALVAALAGGLSRLVPAVVNVQADRASVRLPPVPTSPGAGPAASAASGSVGTASAPPTGAGAVTATLPPLPAGANPAVPGLTPYVTANGTFYRVDTAFVVPRVTTEEWRLKVHGLVDSPFELTWSQLLAMPQVERWLTLTCVSNEVGGNLIGNAAWQGVRVADVLARARPRAGADCVLSTSHDDFTATTPLDVLTDGRDALLAIGMNGEPLPVQHGFPVRLVVPGLYGYVSATKWVVDLTVTKFSEVTAYWTERGWAPRGPIKTASRIDTPGYDVTVGPGIVPVAGVAWAQHRGISAVQVQVDEGPWRDATLAGTASKDTWRQWVYRWNTAGVAAGSHTGRCRAVVGTGAVQVGAVAPPAPDGATGYHEVPVVIS